MGREPRLRSLAGGEDDDVIVLDAFSSDAVPVHLVTGTTLQRAVGTVMVQGRRLCVGGGVDGGRHRVEAMDGFMATLTGDVLVAAGVAHQGCLARVVERRVGVDVAALLHERRRVAIRAVRFAG